MPETKKLPLNEEELQAVSGGVLSEVTDKDGNIIGIYSSVLKQSYFLTEIDGSADMVIARAVEQSASGGKTDAQLIEWLQEMGIIQ